MAKQTTPADALAFDVKRFASLISMSEPWVRQQIANGKIKAHQAGGKTLIRSVDATEWLASLPPAASTPTTGAAE